jgi:Protein of unknown function (DUF2934)
MPSAPVQHANGPRHEEIRERAYQIFVERGGAHGEDFGDWLQAERELRRNIQGTNRASGVAPSSYADSGLAQVVYKGR